MTYDPAIGHPAHPPPSAPRDAAHARFWRPAVLASAAAFLVNALIISTWVSRLPATRDRLDLDTGTIGLTLLMSGVGALVAMPFAGRLAARWRSGPLVMASSGLCSLCLVVLSITPNALTTGAVLFVLGACLGVWDVSMNIQGSFVDRRSGRDYMPRYHASWSVGAAIGALVLGAGAAALGVSLTLHFAVVGIMATGLSALLVVRWYLDDREPPVARVPVVDAEDGSTTSTKPRLLDRRLVLLGIITLCSCLLEGSAADWIALYLTSERAASETIAAVGYGLWAAAMAASRYSGTTLIDRLGRVRAIRLAGAVVLAGVVATLAAPGVYGSLVGVLLWGAGVALVFPAAMSAGGETPGRAAAGIAAVSTIGYGGFLVGPPLIGVLGQHIGLGNALWILPVLGLGIVLLAPIVKPLRATP